MTSGFHRDLSRLTFPHRIGNSESHLDVSSRAGGAVKKCFNFVFSAARSARVLDGTLPPTHHRVGLAGEQAGGRNTRVLGKEMHKQHLNFFF